MSGSVHKIFSAGLYNVDSQFKAYTFIQPQTNQIFMFSSIKEMFSTHFTNQWLQQNSRVIDGDVFTIVRTVIVLYMFTFAGVRIKNEYFRLKFNFPKMTIWLCGPHAMIHIGQFIT